MEGLKKQLEKECRTMVEEGTKYLYSKKSEVESKRCDIETRHKAVLSKVSFIKCNIKTPLETINTKYIHK